MSRKQTNQVLQGIDISVEKTMVEKKTYSQAVLEHEHPKCVRQNGQNIENFIHNPHTSSFLHPNFAPCCHEREKK